MNSKLLTIECMNWVIAQKASIYVHIFIIIIHFTYTLKYTFKNKKSTSTKLSYIISRRHTKNIDITTTLYVLQSTLLFCKGACRIS